MQWHDITLQQFQLINSINDSKDYDEMDKLLYTTGAIFDLTENQMVDMGPDKVQKFIEKTTKLFNNPFEKKPYKYIGYYKINYDIEKIRFGQFVEITYFVQGDILDNAHCILASLANIPLLKNSSKRHHKVSDYFLDQSVVKTMGALSTILDNYTAFNKEYSGLFDLQEDGEEVEVKKDGFNETYGWIYSATIVAEHERITLEQAFDLPVRQALNDLSYLKAKRNYDESQMKKHGAINN
jgi:hypothetical protein